MVVLIIWIVITLLGEWLQLGATTSLDRLVSDGIVYTLLLALLFLVSVVAYFKWWTWVGLRVPDRWGDLRLLWLPLLAVILLIMFVEASGLPEGESLWFMLINTLVIGCSEELMFNGILFLGASIKFGWRRAVWITALTYGVTQGLNELITGDIRAAFLQAGLAVLFGVWMVALRLRLNTIIPLIILHWLWDFGVVSLRVQGGVTTIMGAGLPILFAVLLFLYGFWLLEGYHASMSENLSAR